MRIYRIQNEIHFLQVKEKKYETVGTTSQMLAASMRIMAASSVNMQPFRNPIRSTSIMSSLTHRKNSNGSNNAQAAQAAAAANSANSSSNANSNGRLTTHSNTLQPNSAGTSAPIQPKVETPDAIGKA